MTVELMTYGEDDLTLDEIPRHVLEGRCVGCGNVVKIGGPEVLFEIYPKQAEGHLWVHPVQVCFECLPLDFVSFCRDKVTVFEYEFGFEL